MEIRERTEEELESFRKAGKIASEARALGKEKMVEGTSYYEVARVVENYITEHGAQPAFPVNIAVNNIAAHYSPYHEDKLTFKKGDVVKLDLGANIDGYLSDTAVTVVVGQSASKLSDASRMALETVADIIGPGVSIETIGSTIEDTIHGLGFIPIENLTGHSIERYNLHAGLTIPNVREPNMGKLKDGDIIAIEPFATERPGLFDKSNYSKVADSRGGNIYHLRRHNVPAKTELGNELLALIKERWEHLPFCHRWIYEAVMDGEFKHLSTKNVDKAINELVRRKIVYMYSVLKEVRGQLVSQHEHTFIITSDGAEITTI